MTSLASRRRLKLAPAPIIRTQFRAVDGNRSPYYAALKRSAELKDTTGGYRLVLQEHRQAVIPWIRLPVFTWWHKREFFGQKLEKLEISARVFLETGHMPAQWYV